MHYMTLHDITLQYSAAQYSTVQSTQYTVQNNTVDTLHGRNHHK